MGTVASQLKSEREKRKISLAQIAAETRISLRHLESLEDGRFDDLPGGMYNRAFVKAYCETLHLDNTQEIMQCYEDELSPDSEKPSRVHIPQQSHSFRISPILIWALMLLISATGLFFSRKWITAVFSPYFSHTTPAVVRYEPVQPPAVSKPSTVAAQPSEPQVQTSTPAAAVTESPLPAVQGPATPSQLPSTGTADQQGTEAKAPVQPAATPTAPQTLHLEIDATEKCWVSIDKDGSPALRKIMQPGEVQSLNAAEKFQIILGNAGGVRLKVNGKPAKQMGKPGAVVKFLINGKNLQEILDPTAG